jgi:PhnB protein
MSQQQATPPPPPPVSPYLTVGDAGAAIDFYQRAYGAELLSKQPGPDGKRLIHAALAINGGLVMLSDDFPEYHGGKSSTPKTFGGTPVTIHLDVADVDALWARAIGAGATAVMPLADQFWGDRYGVVEDPFGHRWSMATRKGRPSADELAKSMKEAFIEK